MARTPIQSRLIADVGISMGDEGKGRLIPELIQELKETTSTADPVGVVMKVNGGANSGHTAGGLKLNLLPAGVIAPEPKLVIGCGVVASPRKFWWEIKPLEAAGYKITERLLIDERCMVSDLAHRLLDLAWEDYRVKVLKQEARGSTGRGITPAYQDEVGQWQIYYADFKAGKDAFIEKAHARLDRAIRTIRYVCQVDEATWNGFFETLTNAEMRANKASIEAGLFEASEFDFMRFKGSEPYTINEEAIVEAVWSAGTALADNIVDAREVIRETINGGRYVIGEFGQSYWLDKRHGFSPNVTASHTFTAEMFQSAGLPVQPIHTLGVCKAYDTKVGTHIFLTQMPEGHPLTKKLKELEFGTSTGRQRMVGWFDAVEKGDALRFGGFQDLVINKLDALTYSGDWQGGELLVCTGYTGPDGKDYHNVPRNDALRATLKPKYIQLPGWEEDISKVRTFDNLPYAAKRYIAVCCKATMDVAFRGERSPKHPELRYIGVGPDPDQIIKDAPQIAELLKLA